MSKAPQPNYDQPPPYTPYVTAPLHPGVYVAPPPTYCTPAAPYSNPAAPILGAPFQGYGTTTTTTSILGPAPEIIVVGACPACRVGILEDDYPACALACAVIFFPLGVLCCLAMKNKKCSNCGAMFG